MADDDGDERNSRGSCHTGCSKKPTVMKSSTCPPTRILVPGMKPDRKLREERNGGSYPTPKVLAQHPSGKVLPKACNEHKTKQFIQK